MQEAELDRSVYFIIASDTWECLFNAETSEVMWEKEVSTPGMVGLCVSLLH